MISCTDFIPAYSELFSFLDENYGRGEVEKLWEYLFKPDGKGIPLINFAKKDGFWPSFSLLIVFNLHPHTRKAKMRARQGAVRLFDESY